MSDNYKEALGRFMKKVKKNGRGGMLYEDKKAPSNCPVEVIMSEYPKVDYLYQEIDDTMYGVDNAMRSSVKGVRKQNTNVKY